MPEPNDPSLPDVDIELVRDGRSLADLIDLPPELQEIMQIIIRANAATSTEISAQLNQPNKLISARIDDLLNQGFLQKSTTDSEPYYQPNFTARKRRNLSDQIWDQLK